MGDLVDFTKFQQAKKTQKLEMDQLYDKGRVLGVFEFSVNDRGTNTVRISKQGRTVTMRLMIHFMMEILKRQPMYNWPQSKMEFDYRLGIFGSSILHSIGGPVQFLLYVMHHKVLTDAGAVDLEKLRDLLSKKEGN